MSEPFKTPPRPPEIMSGLRIRRRTPFGHLYMTITIDMKTEREVEIFSHLGKCGEMVSADTEGMCRLASMYLRAGGGIRDVVKQLKGIGTHFGSSAQAVSVPDCIGSAVQYYLEAKKKYGIRALILGEVQLDEPEEVETGGGGKL